MPTVRRLVMDAILETTVWKGVKRQPNHIYLMDGSKAVAYIKWGLADEEPFYFSKPLPFDRRGRTFTKADVARFKGVRAKSNTIQVQGSKGNTYTVDPDAKTCTCPGFTFRGNCKHLSQVNI